MIVEINHDKPNENTFLSEHVERRRNVRSVDVLHGCFEDNHYARVGIATPHGYSNFGLREDGPYKIEVFDDVAHDARGSAVCGPEERWLKTVVSEDLYRELDRFVTHESLEYTNTSEVVCKAVSRFLETERENNNED